MGFRRVIFLLFLLHACLAGVATHNRAGEITYTWIGNNSTDFTYRIKVTTYTKIGFQIVADRCDLTVYFGDGDSGMARRINGPSVDCLPPSRDGVAISSDMQLNIYEVDHTYTGAGMYTISMFDPNRNSDIINIPNSVSIPFYLEAFIFIHPFLGPNNSVIMTYPPIDDACVGKCFYHNPGAYDPDGQDSIAYDLGVCLGFNGGNPIPAYYIPNGVTLDSVTGDFIWCTPQPGPNPPFTTFPQEWNFVIYIKEYRKYNNTWYMMGYTLRDMQVDVYNNCNNDPPDIAAINDTCVLAGDLLTFQVTSGDINNDIVTLSATGAPISLLTPAATFTNPSGPAPVTGTFSWQTTCDLVRLQPYQVLFKAIDNDPNVQLVDLESMFITIVAPAPTGLNAIAQCNSVSLTWDSASCDPNGNQVIGYYIFMDDTCNPWTPAVCETGVPSYTGYQQVGYVSGKTNTSYVVNNLVHGVRYSFRVVTAHLDGARSYASNGFCIILKQDVPILTHVDVTSTSTSTGSMDIKWKKPSGDPVTGLDTNLYIPPYRYDIYRAPGFTGPVTLVSSITAGSYSGLNVTSFSDAALNTADSPYVYRIDFYSNNNFICQTRSASSVYLNLTPSDNTVSLSWNFNVPWSNYMYHIYKEIPASSNNWVLIDSTTALVYTDDSLVNGNTYCYYVEAFGQYSDTSIIRPLRNRSERKCAVPQDLTPPCPPVLGIDANCADAWNFLNWTNPNLSCADDVVSYNIYYAPVQDQDLAFMISVSPATAISYMHDSLTSIAGCYAVTAIDSFGNQSALSNIVCVENCPIYELPNVFTPNGDGSNDLFIPFPYKYVEDIDLHIYNRWGEEIFTTQDPDIMWDGRHKRSGQLCADGVYYYVCKVNEIRLKGVEARVLTGFVHLISTK